MKKFLSLALICLVASVSVARAENFEGSYDIESAVTPTGAKYSGSVTVHRAGPGYMVGWRLNDNSEYRGYGLEVDGKLAVAYGLEDTAGLVAYSVSGGELVGKWTGIGASRSTTFLGEEILVGSPELDGDYRIVRGINQDGSSYTGNVSITPKGDGYAVSWNVGGSKASGTALKSGRVLAAAFGEGSNGAGIVIYERRGSFLEGEWIPLKGTKRGTERLRAR